MEPRQDQRRLRRSLERYRQQPREFGHLGLVARPARRDALVQKDQRQMPQAGILVPDETSEDGRRAELRVETAGQSADVGSAQRIVEGVVCGRRHRRMLTGTFPAPPARITWRVARPVGAPAFAR